MMPIHIKTDLLIKRKKTVKLYSTPPQSRVFPHSINPCQTAGPGKGNRYQKKRAKGHASVTFVLTSEIFFSVRALFTFYFSALDILWYSLKRHCLLSAWIFLSNKILRKDLTYQQGRNLSCLTHLLLNELEVFTGCHHSIDKKVQLTVQWYASPKLAARAQAKTHPNSNCHKQEGADTNHCPPPALLLLPLSLSQYILYIVLNSEWQVLDLLTIYYELGTILDIRDTTLNRNRKKNPRLYGAF